MHLVQLGFLRQLCRKIIFRLTAGRVCGTIRLVLLERKEITYYSQFCEDALVHGLFRKIDTTNKILCDIGASDGTLYSNSRFFMEQPGWDGAFVEPHSVKHQELTKLYSADRCLKESVTVDKTIDSLLEQMSFPKRFDLLNLDIDGQEYYVWEAMTKYRARIVIVEWSPYVALDFVPVKGSDGRGGENQTGLFPMLRLARRKDYKVVAITPVNLICVEGDLLKDWKRYWEGEFPLPFTLRKERTCAVYTSGAK